jgi:hypothetical protein
LTTLIDCALLAVSMAVPVPADREIAAVDRLKAGAARDIVGDTATIEIATPGRVNDAAGGILLEDDVDDPGDGIGAVLCSGTLGVNLDVIDRVDRNHVDVHVGGALVRGTDIDRQVGGGVAALAVDQHQHIVGTQPVQTILECLASHIGAERLHLQ